MAAVTGLRFSLDADGSVPGAATALLSITDGSGLLLITRTGMAGELSVSAAFHLPAGILIGFDTVSVAVNTTAAAVTQTFSLPSGHASNSFHLPFK